MSAKDVRNIWERIFSYFERLLTCKTKGGDWVISLVPLVVIFLLALRYGGSVGGFTFVLAVATIWNVKITQGLLRRSEEASRQSRRALENDVFRNIVFSTSQVNLQLRIARFPTEDRTKYVENFATGMLATLKNIDPSTFEKISEVIETWNKIDKRFPAITYLRALNKTKGKQVPNKPKKRIGNG